MNEWQAQRRGEDDDKEGGRDVLGLSHLLLSPKGPSRHRYGCGNNSAKRLWALVS